MPLRIAYPDYDGKGSVGEFGKKIAEMYPEAMLVPILNGKDQEMLRQISRSLKKPFNPVVVGGQGLLQATLEGYESITNFWGNDPVIKLDTAEHPLEWIGPLAERAKKINGFVVGDLDFSGNPELLVEGTPDWFAHVFVFPSLYGRATRGLLPLSCAHGFQAFAAGVLPRILAEIRTLLQDVKQRWGEKPRYGLDGAAALAAVGLSIPVERILVPGYLKRNRPAPKVGEQTDAAIRMCLAGDTSLLLSP